MANEKVDVEKLKVLTTEFRVSHPHVFKPSKIPNSDKEAYSIEMLFDKTTTELKSLQDPVKWAAIGKWGPNKADWPSPLKYPFRDGDKPKFNKKTKKTEVRPEHKGMWVVRASSNADYAKPHVVGANPKIPIANEADFYPGCYARAALKAHAYEVGDQMGVKFILDGVQKTKDGEAFGGKRPADQTFGVLEVDNDENFMPSEEGTDDGTTEESFF